MDEGKFYSITAAELRKIAEIGDFDVKIRKQDPQLEMPIVVPDVVGLKRDMAHVAVVDGPEAFCNFVMEHDDAIKTCAALDDSVIELLVMLYKLGIDAHFHGSANELGSLYYLGNLIDRDYAKAEELYLLAAKWGGYRSIVNLGYIYEYGRVGEPDYRKAYEYYSLAAALQPDSEALFKLGDMFARGHAVERDIRRAHDLWVRSLDEAENVVEEAHPALRLASLLVNIENNLFDIEFNPLRALYLYQKAEVGLRLEIEAGATFYYKELEEALAGQEKARSLVVAQKATPNTD